MNLITACVPCERGACHNCTRNIPPRQKGMRGGWRCACLEDENHHNNKAYRNFGRYRALKPHSSLKAYLRAHTLPAWTDGG